MALNVYCGLQGSGKSFECVSLVIVPSILKGRTIVTNIEGVNEVKIYEYLQKKHPKSDSSLYGKVVHVTNDRVLQPHFFYDSEAPDSETVVQRGDIVCIDEAWRFWGTDSPKVSHEHMQFFRMHRHYIHPETNLSSDIVLMTQDISGLTRSVKNVVEFTFAMKKFKSLGLGKRYRVDIFESYKLNKGTRIDYYVKKYDPDIFPLYQSYSGGVGVEQNIDNRQNIFSSKKLWFLIFFIILMVSISGYFIYKFFHPNNSNANNPPNPITGTSTNPITGVPIPPTLGANGQPVIPKPNIPQFSKTWRIAGSIHASTGDWVVLADNAGNMRYESPSSFYGSGNMQIGTIDGERIARWTGSVPASSGGTLK